VPAHPYRLIVLDPRPSLQAGQAYIQEFDVDAPIPSMIIPLNAGDALPFDFGVPYRKTLEEELYGLELVDYQELPARFNRYRTVDQTRIAVRMVAILQAAHAGVDLDRGPFPIRALPLEAALAEIRRLQEAMT
jgi:hypothetical protein